MELCTYSFLIHRNGKDVPFESIPKEEQEAFKDKFTEDFMDIIMRGQGYRKVEETTNESA